MIRVNDNCVNLIKSFEGLKLEAYHDSIDKPGVDTIGYGTIQYPPYYRNGARVRVGDPKITESQALEFLRWEIGLKAKAVYLLIRDDLTDNQFGALISFAYNLGEGALKQSHLRMKVNNNPKDPSIRDEFMKWDLASGHVVEGLQRRRKAEADLYFKD